MAEKPDQSGLPKITAEQRRAAAGLYERAQQVLATGNIEYGLDLLRQCCSIEPGSIIYRQALRHAQKNRYENNGKGQPLFSWRGLPAKLRLYAALGTKDYVKALMYGEELLTRNPWNTGALLAMAEAMEGLNLLDQALWTLDEARRSDPKSVRANRRMAQILERLGNFAQAVKLWEIVRRVDPRDEEAQQKVKDLAASETIARGRYEDVIEGTVDTPSAVGQKAAAEERPPVEQPVGEDVGADQSERGERGAKDVAAIEAKIQARPRDAGNYLHLASIYRRHEQPDKARTVLEQGMVQTGNHFEIAMELADLAIEPFRHNLAIADDRLSKGRSEAELVRIRAKLVKEINSRELDLFRQKADRYPTDKSHHFEMGVRLLALDQVDEAIKELQATRTDPRYRTKSLYYLGFCFKQRNNWRLAQRNFEEALQNLGGGDIDLRKELLFQLASGLAESGDLVRAYEIGCDLANIDYGYRNIGSLIHEWQQRQA